MIVCGLLIDFTRENNTLVSLLAGKSLVLCAHALVLGRAEAQQHATTAKLRNGLVSTLDEPDGKEATSVPLLFGGTARIDNEIICNNVPPEIADLMHILPSAWGDKRVKYTRAFWPFIL